MPTDQQIESEIQAKCLTAPRVTPQQIESVIAEELYFTAADGVRANGAEVCVSSPACLLTICVLILNNGFTVLGKSACASPENFNQELGRKIARADAVNQIWPLEGYLLKQQLHNERVLGLMHEATKDSGRQCPQPPIADPNHSAS